VFAAGSVLEWLGRLGLVASPEEADQLAASARDSDEVACVPALAGLAAPYWDRAARAAWLGMGLEAGRGELVRAALEGVACRVAQVVRAMEYDGEVALPALFADGGLTRCSTLMQMQADLLGVPVEIAADEEATVRGVCFMAARAAGLWKGDEAIARRRRPGRRVEPGPASARRRERLQRFERAVEVVRGWHAGPV
jgi:glycerol kinase